MDWLTNYALFYKVARTNLSHFLSCNVGQANSFNFLAILYL